MKSVTLIATVALAFIPAIHCVGEVSSHLRIEILLNKFSADKAGMSALRDGLDVTPGGFVLVGDQKQMYAVAWGGVRRVDELSGLSAFAFTPDGLLMGIRGQELLHVDKTGSLKRLFFLPSADMGISPGYKDKMFLFEHASKGSNALFELHHGKKARKLLVSPEPISGVVETDDGRILFAAGNALYLFASNKRLQILVVAPGKNRITSVARDPDTGQIYLSNGESIFAVAGGQSTLITRESGGTLHWFNGGLMVLDSKKQLLIRVVGIAEEIDSKSHATSALPR